MPNATNKGRSQLVRPTPRPSFPPFFLHVSNLFRLGMSKVCQAFLARLIRWFFTVLFFWL